MYQLMNEKSIFYLAKTFAEIDARLDGASKNKGYLASCLNNNERTAITLEIIHRLINGSEANHKRSKITFGELDNFIDSIVAQLNASVGASRTDSVSIFKKFVDVKVVLEAIKNHGIDWIPDRYVDTGKFVAITNPIMFFSYEPLRILFISYYLSKIDKNLISMAVITYLSSLSITILKEIQLLKKYDKFTINPYVSILALKFKPEFASLFTRITRLVTDSSTVASLYFFSKESTLSANKIAAPLLFFSASWLILETLANTSLAVFFKHLDGDK